jgi:hypothetical protein
MGVRSARRCFHLLVSELGVRPVGDISPHRVVEQHRVLADDSRELPERLEPILPCVDTIEQNPTRRWLVEPRDEIDERALPCPAGSDQRDDFAAAGAE